MIGAIPNPTKKVTIDFPISQVSEAVTKIPNIYSKYRMDNVNQMFNQYTLSALEFLSLGVFIDINLTEVSENRTEINIEVRRKMGAFDSWVEVQNANTHLQNVITGITKNILNPNLEVLQTQKVEDEGNWPYVIGFVIGILILYAIM